MKKGTNYIPQSDLEKLARELGLTVVEQKGFIKVAADSKHRVYIAKTKLVGRVDLSGFKTSGIPGVVDLGGESFGMVHQQIDFTRPAPETLETFQNVLLAMTALAEGGSHDQAITIPAKAKHALPVVTASAE